MLDAPGGARIWRQLWQAVLLAALVLIPRSYLMSRALSETLDDDFHLKVGVLFLRGEPLPPHLNDPPLGGVLGAIPVVPGIAHETNRHTYSALNSLNNPWSRERILSTVAVWKTILFLPAIGLIFYWLARVYGPRAGWLGVALIAFEPNFAGHIPVCSIDVIGVEAILFGSFFIWRYFEKPTFGRAVYTTAIVATCMTIKHTAILLPAVAVAFAGLFWVIRPWRQGILSADWREHWRQWLGGVAIFAIGFPLAIFALTKFDRSPMGSTATATTSRSPRRHAATQLVTTAPTTGVSHHHRIAAAKPKLTLRDWLTQPKLTLRQWLASHRIPGGMYYSSIFTAQYHTSHGHPEYFNGHYGVRGWWYYFPVVSLYKIPIPNLILLTLALLSLIWIKPRWQEWSLAVPMMFWTALMIKSPIDIGFRHFLPPYAFMLMMTTRLMLTRPIAVRAFAWICTTATAIHSMMYFPDYIAYLNYPRTKPQLAINDSNLDWGQSMFEIVDWANAHKDRPVAIRLFYGREYHGPQTTHYTDALPHNAYVLSGMESLPGHESERPVHGYLIISPIRELAIYEAHWLDKKQTIWGVVNPYESLKSCKPVDVIGHNMAVYDLDQIQKDRGYIW